MRVIFKRAAVILVGLIALSIYVLNSEKTNSIQSFDEVDFSQFTEGDLVVFDVDETLIQPTDSYLINMGTPHAKAFKADLVKKNPQVKNWDELKSIILEEAERPLMEPNSTSKINDLKERGVWVIACTAMNSGPFGKLESMESWRYAHLKALGFTGNFEDKIIHLPHSTKKPVFYRGIIATDLIPKGESIKKFLEAMQIHPRRIILFDDIEENHTSVRNTARELGVGFIGYQYHGYKKSPWTPELYSFQADYLIANKKWIGDEKAKELMAQN